MAPKASRRSTNPSSSVKNNQVTFEDLDLFWKLSLTKEPPSSTVAKEKRLIPTPSSSKSNVSLASTITTSTDDVDFNYNDSDSITDDDISVSATNRSATTQYTPSVTSRLTTPSVASDTSAGNLFSQDSANPTNKPTERDSISSELRPKPRGRPPKSRPSTLSQKSDASDIANDDEARTGAQAPIGFVDDFLSTSPPLSIASSQGKTLEATDDASKTPKPSLKTGQSESAPKSYRLSSNFRPKVSFSGDKKTSNVKVSPTKQPSETYPDDYDDFDGGDLNMSANNSISKSSARKSIASITPATSRGISTPGSFDFPRGTLLDRDDENDVYKDDGEDTDEEDFNESFVVETSFNESLLKKAKTYQESETEDGTRRSRRVTKGQKFEYWKNERPVYAQGDLVGLMIAMPTPAKTISNNAKKNLNKTKLFAVDKKSKDSAVNTKDLKRQLREESKVAEQDSKPPKLPKHLKLIDRETAQELYVWSDHTEKVEHERVVAHRDKLEAVDLTADPDGSGKVSRAAHMFNVSGIPRFSNWISGFVELPPGTIKDAEATGDFVQVFFLADAQDLSLEFALSDPRKTDWNDQAAQRQLLRKGDSFYIPPGNIYRLENHSSSKTAILNWVIIQPVPQPLVE